MTAAELACAVLDGTLGCLSVEATQQLCSGVVFMTDSLPTLLHTAQRMWRTDSSPLPAVAIPVAGKVCTSLAHVLTSMDRCISSGAGAGPAGGKAATASAAAAQFLRMTAAGPSLVLSALDALTLVVAPNEAIRWNSREDAQGGLGCLCPSSLL